MNKIEEIYKLMFVQSLKDNKVNIIAVVVVVTIRV